LEQTHILPEKMFCECKSFAVPYGKLNIYKSALSNNKHIWLYTSPFAAHQMILLSFAFTNDTEL